MTTDRTVLLEMLKKRFVALIDKGLTIKEIAIETKLGKFSTYYYMRRFDLKAYFKTKSKSKKECKLCQEKDISKFRKDRSTLCRKCEGKDTLFRHYLNKCEDVEYLGGKCSKCGYDKCMASLDVHHIDPKTKDPRCKYIRRLKNFERRKIELDKCILLCRNCHSEEHHIKNEEFYKRIKCSKA